MKLTLCLACLAAPAFVDALALRNPSRVHGTSRPCGRAMVRLAEEERLDASDISSLYESLRKRRSDLSSRRDAAKRERELLAALAEVWPTHEVAQNSMWAHWFGEEGEKAGDSLRAADGDASVLADLIEQYPDWAEPANRLATLRYLEGDYEESVQLCLRVLRMKPWHFGAGGGIVMCYAKLAEQASVLRRSELVDEASRWAGEAMPQPGQRDDWVKRMLALMDAKLAELDEISDSDEE